MNTESRLISLIIKQMVSSDKNKEIVNSISINKVNWERFKDLVIYHELTPFAYVTLKDFNSFPPQDLREFLKNNYYCALVHCQHLWQEFLRILIAFQQMGIVVLPIKGMALLYDIYPDKPVRPMTDIDLLVKEENLPKAEAIFCDLGYRKELYDLKEEYWRKSQCHITFYKKEEKKLPFVELHWSLDFKRKGRTVLSELWERTRSINIEGMVIRLLSPEDTLFSLALHSRRFGRTLCLKNVYDLALFLNKFGNTFDWDYVLKEARQGKMCSTIFFLLSQATILLGQKIPVQVWGDLDIPRWKQRSIRQFIEKNTFLPANKAGGRELYLKSHFLLYDSLWEPLDYILNIPREQFAKYYGLQTYDKKTDFLYRNRLFYIPFKAILNLISGTDGNKSA